MNEVGAIKKRVHADLMNARYACARIIVNAAIDLWAATGGDASELPRWRSDRPLLEAVDAYVADIRSRQSRADVSLQGEPPGTHTVPIE